MIHHHLLRIGPLGHLVRARTLDGTRPPRGARVVCRTARGIELGEVVAAVAAEGEGDRAAVAILRRATTEDHLLQQRMERYKRRAVEACRQEMAAAGITTTLMEVEHLHDAQTLIFHFLGPIDPPLTELTERLAARYERAVRLKQFAKLLSDGCGPGCGTERSGGGCSGGCAVCVAASVCGTKPATDPPPPAAIGGAST